MNNNNLQLKAAIVLTALVFSISSSTASIYNKTCFNPSAYNGSASWNSTGGGPYTCDVWYASFSGTSQPLANVNWGTVTASTYPKTFDAIWRVNALTPTCCSDGKSLLWTDYSKSCYTNSAYNGAAMLTAGGQTQSCNAWYNHFSYETGKELTGVNWATVTASTYPTNDGNIASMTKDTCCTDGKSITYTPPTDYSKSCYNNSAYSGSVSWTHPEGAGSNTCDGWYDLFSDANNGIASMKTLNWTTVTASTYPTDAEAVERVTMLSPACCSDGKSILWTAATTTSAPGLDESSSKISSEMNVFVITSTLLALFSTL